MKLQAILVIVLLLPSVSIGQTETDDVPWDFDVSAPVRGTEVKVGFGRKLWNSFGLIFAPDVVKRSWPLYAYDPTKVVDADPCQDGSRFTELTVGHDVALITKQTSRDSSGYEGFKLQPRAVRADTGTDAVLRFDDLCGTFRDDQRIPLMLAGFSALDQAMHPEAPNLSVNRSLQPLNKNDGVSSDGWVLLMEGTVREPENDSESAFVWNIPDSPLSLKWTSVAPSDSHPAPIPDSDDTWRFHTRVEDVDLPDNLFITQLSDVETVALPDGRTVEWHDVNIAPGSRFRIWYEPPTSDPTKVVDADPCQDGSRFTELTVGHDVALITKQTSRDSSGYEGFKLQPRAVRADTGTDAVLRFDDLCGTFRDDQRIPLMLAGFSALDQAMHPEAPNLSVNRSLQPLNKNDGVSSDGWVLLMEGTVREPENDSESAFVWNIPDSPLSLKWTSVAPSDSHPAPIPDSDDTWRFHTRVEDVDLPDNLFITQLSDVETVALPDGRTVEWHDVDIAPGSRFRIWYEPPTSEQNATASWYLLSDEPVPGIASDLRIDRQAFAGLDG